ncbi:MAG: recombination protein NinB [Polaromonas sp.]|nr:recombination protein NinB [Polaromonas sp.]
MTKQLFRLVHTEARRRAAQCIHDAPDGYMAVISQPTRTLDQNAKFHALCSDIAKAKTAWAGKPRNAAQWKVLLVSGHATATKEGSDMVPGIEGEYVNLRESTAAMSKKRGASLIEYTLAFCVMNDVKFSAVGYE